MAERGRRAKPLTSAPRFTFFGGKGGVGKTTCAAAAAVRAATDGARVLVVSTDPAHSLRDALGLSLGIAPRRIAGVRGDLRAAELDADRALARWVRDREGAIRTIAGRGTYLDDEDIDRLLSLSVPGVDELVGLVELVRLSRTRAYDLVVVDTAPTGHTLRLLEMPDTLSRIAQVLDDMHAKHRLLASSLGRAWRPDFADDTIVAIEEEAASLRALLTNRSRASFTWVTLAEELPVRESESAVRALEARGVFVETVVANRVWPAPDRPCPLCTPRVHAEREWCARIAASFGDKRVLTVPARVDEPRGVRALLELARSVCSFERKPERARERAPAACARSAPSEVALEIPRSVRLAWFGGKGGVGKTTIAAASAIALAEERPRERVLLLSTDPAHSLSDALGVSCAGVARRVPGGPPNLDAWELDATGAWEVQRERYREAIDDLFTSFFRGRMDASFDRQVLEDLLDLAPPGIDELVAIATLQDALFEPGVPLASATRAHARRSRYELVVVDTAPTGHTLRLLALPEAALDWVHALMTVILKYRTVIGLGEIASDLTDLARRLRSMIALLSDPARCAFVAVSRPAALPRLETERLARELRRLRVPLSAIVANAVTGSGCARCEAAAAAERPELARLARLAARASGTRPIAAPAIYPGPRGVDALRAFRQSWSSAFPDRSG